jgi:hypothetical protein
MIKSFPSKLFWVDAAFTDTPRERQSERDKRNTNSLFFIWFSPFCYANLMICMITAADIESSFGFTSSSISFPLESHPLNVKSFLLQQKNLRRYFLYLYNEIGS